MAIFCYRFEEWHCQDDECFLLATLQLMFGRIREGQLQPLRMARRFRSAAIYDEAECRLTGNATHFVMGKSIEDSWSWNQHRFQRRPGLKCRFSPRSFGMVY
jgi:hypothetical protein